MPETCEKNKVGVKGKPEWLKVRIKGGEAHGEVVRIVEENGLHTICESGRCPNKADCWSRKTATFMVLGEICTRTCKFCATNSGKPLPIDPAEPEKVASAVALMGLKHAVITSVTRDDLADGGAEHWRAVVEAVRAKNPNTKIEVLIPDFGGNVALLDIVLAARPDIVGHNLETVKRFTPEVRSRARYDVSLGVLRHIAASGAVAKSGLMVGLGETAEEVLTAMDDLREAGVSSITLGQYLQPTRAHLQVVEYVTPAMFEFYRQAAADRGFTRVSSGPLVRSSYMADAS